MKLPLAEALLCAACSLLAAPAVIGHGANFRGTLPPAAGRTPNVPRPPAGRSPSAPSPATPGAPAPSAPAPSTPPAVPPQPPGGDFGPWSRPDGPLAAPDRGTWREWWVLNRDAYLDLKRILAGLDAQTGSDGFSLGFGETTGRSVAGIDEKLVHEEVFPVLVTLLQEGGVHPDLTRTALIALARIEASWGDARPTEMSRMADHFITVEARAHPEMAEVAVVAHGVRGRPQAVENLVDILLDTRRARERMGVDATPYRIRALAAYSLGLIGYHQGGAPLRRRIAVALIEDLRNAYAPFDVQVAEVVALGMVPIANCELDSEQGKDASPRPHFCLGAQLAALGDVLVDARRHPRLRAHAAVPLARLGVVAGDVDRAYVARTLLASLQPRSGVTSEIREACVAALGLVGDADGDEIDCEVRRALRRVLDEGSPLERAFALISLARVSARPGRGEVDEEGAAAIRKLLLTQLARGRGERDDWAALALGVHATTLAAHGRVLPEDVALALRSSVKRTRLSEDLSAHCIALGLARHGASTDVLLQRLLKGRSPRQRTAAALGLGLVGAGEARDPLLELLPTTSNDPGLYRSVALGLRLLGDRSVVPELVRALEETDDPLRKATYLAALGSAGDVQAVAPLLAALGDADLPNTVRTVAAHAIGELCDTARRPWAVPISSDLHPALLNSTLVSYSKSGTGILEMR